MIKTFLVPACAMITLILIWWIPKIFDNKRRKREVFNMLNRFLEYRCNSLISLVKFDEVDKHVLSWYYNCLSYKHLKEIYVKWKLEKLAGLK